MSARTRQNFFSVWKLDKNLALTDTINIINKDRNKKMVLNKQGQTVHKLQIAIFWDIYSCRQTDRLPDWS